MTDRLPSSVSAALGGQGAPCPTITFCGKSWKIGWPTQEAKLWHELLVAQHAKDDLELRHRTMTPTEYAQERKDLGLALHAGQHCVSGSLWLATIGGPHCMPLFLLSLLKEHQPDAEFKDARVLWGAATRELRGAMSLVMPPFAPILVEDLPKTPEEKVILAMWLTKEFMSQIAPAPLTKETEKPTIPTPEETPNSSPAPTA